MATVKLTIEYDGSQYSGFQSQRNADTVQDCLEAALLSILGSDIRVRAAGRTDSGVHAEGQVVAFDYDGSVVIDDLKRALNAALPEDVSVSAASASKPGFDPRREASARVYEYRILNRPERSALDRGRALWVPRLLNLNLMRQASEALIGQRDFRHFATAESGHMIRSVFECACWRQGDRVFIRIRANAFAKRMVRRIAGTLVRVGLGKWEPSVVGEMLSENPNSVVAPSLPPHGLYLVGVEYGRRTEVRVRSEQEFETVVSKSAR